MEITMILCKVFSFLFLGIFLNSHRVPLIDAAKSTNDADDFDWDGDYGDFLDSVSSMADMLTDLVGDGHGCKFTCKNGAKPKPKKGHQPKTNGCGSFGLELDTSSVPGVTRCCDLHDFCYDTCNKDKEKCDSDFKLCLDSVCDDYERQHGDDEDVINGCYSTSELMYTGTMTLGCKPYKDSQRDACTCDHDEL